MGHEMLIGFTVQTSKTICFRVAHLAVVDGITYMDGKKPTYAFDTRKVEITAATLLFVLYGTAAVFKPEGTITIIAEQMQIVGTAGYDYCQSIHNILLDIVIAYDKSLKFSDLKLLQLNKSRISHKYFQQATLLSNFNCDCELKSQK